MTLGTLFSILRRFWSALQGLTLEEGPTTATAPGPAVGQAPEGPQIENPVRLNNAFMNKLTQQEQDALTTTAAGLLVPAQWLYNLINLETNGTFDPGKENDKSHAKGLIQFMPDTARALGYKDQYDLVNKNPTRVAQLLGPVKKYLSQFAPFQTEQSFYLSVFYPALRTAPPDTAFPPIVQKYNPGIVYVKDYVNIVKNFKGSPAKIIKVAGVLIVIGLIGFIIKKYLEGTATP